MYTLTHPSAPINAPSTNPFDTSIHSINTFSHLIITLYQHLLTPYHQTPSTCSITLSYRSVCNWYKTSFHELRDCPAPVTAEKEMAFSKVIESIYERHSSTLITMARGAHEIRTTLTQDMASFAEHHQVQKKLDEFYMSRIGIRMLIGQYLALRKPQVHYM